MPPKSYIELVIMIVNTTRLTVTPEKRDELVQTIRRLLGSTGTVKGCRTFSFYLDAVDENSSLLMSEWETEWDLERYLRSNNFAILCGAIKVLRVHSIDSKAHVTSHVFNPAQQVERVRETAKDTNGRDKRF